MKNAGLIMAGVGFVAALALCIRIIVLHESYDLNGRNKTSEAMSLIGELLSLSDPAMSVLPPDEYHLLLDPSIVSRIEQQDKINRCKAIIHSGRDIWGMPFWTTVDAATLFLHSSGPDQTRGNFDDIVKPIGLVPSKELRRGFRGSGNSASELGVKN